MTEKFSIQWNDFQSNVKLAFSQFRSRTHFQDVTLVSDDHQQITAHRVVLSAFMHGLSFSCDFCEKIMFSRTSVRDHKLMSKCFLGNTR